MKVTTDHSRTHLLLLNETRND